MPKELPKAYNPADFEDAIYKRWEESGFFNPDNLKGEPYSIMMPPPNVTGVLHLGHALENSLMDIMARYQRMNGKKVLLLPGTDHAAVATQAKVEKVLVGEGIKNPRQELGREKLLEKIRDYAENSKTTILKQIKKMGTSCDWSRLAYTFDEARNRAVNEIFVKMYNDGLIYRGNRVVNWSVKGQSTCSDDELVHVERATKLYTLKYSKDFPIAVATTRPETKFGDTAVAVNPKDKRYKKYIGKTFTVEVGAVKSLTIKIIADENVDEKFGTGAIGVTPAHSLVDFEMYEKQKAVGKPISLIQVIGQDGKMTANAGKAYAGLPTLEARAKFVSWLKAEKLLEKEEEITQNVGTSDRFGDVIEVLPMTQWFVDVNKIIPGKNKSLKDLMREAVTTGHNGDENQKAKITPERFEKIYLHWINNLRDWCISRQIWWGHRIPVWYCGGRDKGKCLPECHRPIISTETPKECPVCGSKDLFQDEDTLDTWFSSGTWTFSTLRWPGNQGIGILDITYFVHGTTTDNEQNKGTGWNDGELSKLGKKQNSALKKTLEKRGDKYDIIFTSDLKRARETAKTIFKGAKIISDERLRECNYGDLNGQSESKFKDYKYYIENKHPNGESLKDVEKRMSEFLDEVGEKYAGKRIAIMSHRAPQLALEVIVNNKSWEQAIDGDWRNKKSWQPGWKYVIGHDSDLKTFHPTSWMQMGYEIIYLWLTRMILMSTYTLDQIPFKDVYIHGMLRNEAGKKFSKSSGDNIDPLEIIRKYGTDALRLSAISGVAPGNDSRFYEEKVERARNMVNKLWNVARFIISNQESGIRNQEFKADKLTLADKWILSKFDNLARETTKDLEGYNFSQAAEKLREFTWNDFADWYLEVSKFEKNQEKNKILYLVLENLLKLWHPFMPFVTEYIWRETGKDNLLMVEKWPANTSPQPSPSKGEGAGAFDLIKEIIIAIRNARAENKIEPAQKIKAVIYAGAKKELIESQAELIKGLRTGIDELTVETRRGASGEKVTSAIPVIVGDIEIYLLAEVDKAKEKARLEKEIANLEKIIKALEIRLANKEFTAKAPAEIVKKEKEKLKGWQAELKGLKSK